MKRRALLLVNHRARKGQSELTAAIDQLKQAGFLLIEASTAQPDILPQTIQQHREQVDLVIVGGGDGTLNAALEGLVKTGLPLGILPLGTANDLARTLNIPADLEQACQIIIDGQQKAIDVGWVSGKHFFNVASLGLSVQITRQLSKEAKQRWGVLAYALTAAKVLWQSRPFKVKLRLDDGEWMTRHSVQVAVGNGRYYGGGLTVARDATIDDQRLDVYSLNVRHWWQMIPILPAMRSGSHITWPFVDHFRCQSIEIQTHRHYTINTDGELTAQTPAEFRVVPQAISVFVP